MIELSSLIGKSVISLSSSDICGVINDVYFDRPCKKIAYFFIASNEQNTYLLPFEAAQNISDAVVINDESALISPADADLTDFCESMLEKPAYTLNGALKGLTADILINSTGKVAKILTQDDEIIPSAIASVGDVIFVKSAPAIKTKQRRTRMPKPENDYPVYILEQNDATATIPQTQTVSIRSEAIANAPTAEALELKNPQPPVALTTDTREPVLSHGAFELLLDGSAAYSYDEDAHTPTRVICDYEFLLGRKLGADLCTYTGELIAKKDTAVTGIIVEKARRAGKLVELTLNSVKPAVSK